MPNRSPVAVWKCLALGAALAAGGAGTANAQGSIFFDYRSSTYTIDGFDATFAGANASYAIHLDIDPVRSVAPAGPTIQNFTTRTGATGVYMQGDGSYLSLANVTVVNPSLTTAELSLSSLDPAVDPARYPGFEDLGYSTAIEPDAPGAFASTWITRGVVGGRWAMTFNGGGNGLVNPPAGFDVFIYVLGDWTASPDWSLLGINSGWDWLGPVGYNPGTNLTLFRASNANYTGNNNDPGGNPNITLQFLGAVAPTAVPEPATLALLGTALGVLVVGGAARRRVATRG